MVERRLNVSQARNLLKKLEDQSRSTLLRLGQDIAGPNSRVKMALQDSPLTYRILDYFRDHTEAKDPRIRLRLFESEAELETLTETTKELLGPETERNLEKRARDVSKRVVKSGRDLVTTAQGLHRIIAEQNISFGGLKRPEVKASLFELKKALNKFKSMARIAIDEYFDNQNPLVLDIIRTYDLDAETVKHGLDVACLATELTFDLGFETYFGNITMQGLVEELGEKEAPELFSSSDMEGKKEELFKRELVEIFIGGFTHDAGLWGCPIYADHEERGATIVSETPQVEEISESLVDIVLFHSDLERVANCERIFRITASGDSPDSKIYRKEFGSHLDDAEVLDSSDTKILQKKDLRKILPVAIAEHFVTRSNDRNSPGPIHIISEAVSYCGNGLYSSYMVTLCNSQPKVVAPKRALVKFDGKVAAGSLGHKHLVELSGDIGICIYDEGWFAPHTIRIFRKGPDGGLQPLEGIPPEVPELTERSDPDRYMYVPVGKMGNLSVTVTGIVGKDTYQKNFSKYETWVTQNLARAFN